MDFVFNLSYHLTDWSLPLDHCACLHYFDTLLDETKPRDPTCRIITHVWGWVGTQTIKDIT